MIVLESGIKELFVSKHLIPAIAICDPDLTLGLPAGLTAATGMDAVTHCIESIMSPAINPPGDAIAADGIVRAVRDGMLARAVKDGSDKEARWHMMMASTEGALAFVKGLGSVHALSHAAGRLKSPSLHHGTLNAMFLPAVVTFNASAPSIQQEHRLQRIAQAMGLAAATDIPQAIQDMNARLRLPSGLAAMGVQADSFARVITGALADHCHKTNPRLASADDYQAMLADSM